MKKELTAAVSDLGTPALLGTPAVLWSMMAGELAIGCLLILSDKLPPILIRSLQLFLRF